MVMSVDGSGGQWFSSLLRTGRIYRLIDTALGQGNREERISAIIQLGRSGDPRAVRPLVDCCREGDPAIRRSAIEALGEIGSGRAVDVLIERLDDPGEDPGIRMSAASALATIRNDRALSEVKARVSNPDIDPALRSAIEEMLDRTAVR
ncbi:MAG: HEAT repeat domain-containing protein [Methanolinea sp.]|nr:HEAT repeat domain-containing protein [Methanolinea sp.]